MATSVPISVNAVLLGTSETTVGTVPSGKEWNVATVRLCNTDTVDRTVTIYVYKSPETAGDATTEYKDLTIQAKSTFEYGPVILPATGKISALASAATKVSARIHGWEVTP